MSLTLSGGGAMAWRGLERVVPPALGLATLLLAWAALTEVGIIAPYLLPKPSAVLAEMLTNNEPLLRHGRLTATEALLGFAIGNAVGVVVAVLMGWFPAFKRCVLPLALVTRGMPMVAITPILVLMLDRGLVPIVTVVSIAVYFPTLITMVRGLESADVEYHELLHSLSASRFQRLLIVELPAALPYLFTALKIGASIAFIVAITGEWVGASAGLGYLIVISGEYFKLAMMWSAIIVASGLTLATLGCVMLAERLLARWTARGEGMA
ncbi:ABC transporter permease [Falsiroseomonas ponticola]|uniref:ABC transporter permease n=1 Tax=Falsiroseomonas ponticola TaxID=2786951 RepID=UPI0019343320|nr:ABC transporter permease [Roseomonas ponticola]